MTYTIRFTDLAKGFSAKVGGMAVVEERIRGEIGELLAGDLDNIGDLMFHVVSIGDVDFICSPDDSETLIVDTATYEEGDKLKSGPRAGMAVRMPRGDSEE